ncbi:MAG: EAL domain-containing protein [Gammaproteobacteria bacterium]|nr:EAL domain-containing protein [Gammaproteobacteria bacterium]
MNTLRNADLVIHPVIIGSEVSLREAQNDPAPDMILCAADKKPIRFNSILNLCLEYFPQSPVIVLYDDQDPEVLLKAMQRGARDVVSAEDPKHLVLVVKREYSDLRARRELQQAVERLRQAEDRYTAIIEHSNDAIAYIHDGMHVMANPAYLKKFGYVDMDELEGQPILDLVAPQDLLRLKGFLRSRDSGNSELELTCQNNQGNNFQANLEFSMVTLDGEHCTQLVIRATPPSIQRTQRLSMFGTRSLDTGLANKLHLLQRLDARIREKDDVGLNCTLLYVLIQDFHQIRAAIGIPSSDQLLKELASILKDNIEEGCFLAQFGNDAFVIQNEGSLQDSTRIADRLMDSINNHLFAIDGDFSEPQCSIGLAHLDEAVTSGLEFINRAFIAAESGRTQNESKYTVFEGAPAKPESRPEVKTTGINSIIQHALDNDEFKLLYQPVVSLQGDNRENYAVLLRMLDKDRQQVLPSDFIDAAIQSSQMLDIDRWVVKRAIMEMADQRKQGRKVSFFISVSHCALESGDFVVWVCDCLRQYKARGAWLTLQIRDRDIHKYTQKSKRFIEDLKKIKCQISIDQYGSVSKNDTLIRNLPVDYIKYAPALISNLSARMEKQQRLSEFNQQAQKNNVKTIAMGVEDASNLALLWTTGVDYIQGYFLQGPSERTSYDFTLL